MPITAGVTASWYFRTSASLVVLGIDCTTKVLLAITAPAWAISAAENPLAITEQGASAARRLLLSH